MISNMMCANNFIKIRLKTIMEIGEFADNALGYSSIFLIGKLSPNPLPNGYEVQTLMISPPGDFVLWGTWADDIQVNVVIDGIILPGKISDHKKAFAYLESQWKQGKPAEVKFIF